jgi:hypothetical protein
VLTHRDAMMYSRRVAVGDLSILRLIHIHPHVH